MWETNEGESREHYCYFLLFGSALIVRGSELVVGRGRMSYSHFHSCCYPRKWRRGVSPRFCLVVLVWIKIIRKQGGFKIALCNLSGEKIILRASASCNELLGRVASRILPNTHDGAPPQKWPTALRHWLFPEKNTTADFKLDSKCASNWKVALNVGCRWTASVWNL